MINEQLCDFLGIQLTVIDQTDIHNMITERFPVEGNVYSKGQLRSYMRTPVNYYAAQLLSQQGYPAVVMGTGNKDEDGYLAYFCKYGDGAVDVQLISDLHKSQVFMVAKEFSVINSILKAKPSDDLWEGHTDEAEMGVSYDFVEFLTGYYFRLSESESDTVRQAFSLEERQVFENSKKRCDDIHKKNLHKLKGVVNL
jgi:NAD+ synthase (glutamine-hydrolysing)